MGAETCNFADGGVQWRILSRFNHEHSVAIAVQSADQSISAGSRKVLHNFPRCGRMARVSFLPRPGIFLYITQTDAF